MKGEQALKQSLVENSLIEVLVPAEVGPSMEDLALRAIEIAVANDPVHAGEDELAVAKGESEDFITGRGVHADTPLGQVGGTELCREVTLTSSALYELI
jgi:hypothetical protein